MTTTSSEQRLHPVSVIFDIGRRLPRLLVPLIVLLFATQPQRDAARLAMPWIAGFIVLLVVSSVARHLRYSYRYDRNDLVIRSGLFIRNVRTIPYVRIQNLDAAQNLVHRLFGVAVVHVQTGGGAEPEASLRVLPASALAEMRARVLQAGGRATSGERHHRHPVDGDTPALDRTPAEPPAPRTLLVLGPRDLVLAGFIENRGMVLIAGGIALLEQTGAIQRLIESLFRNESASLEWLTETQGVMYAVVALLAVLLFIRVLSTVWAVVRLYDFRLERIGDELHTEYGLFTRVSATIPLRRVQTVIVRDRVLHRVFGRHEVVVETAGGALHDSGVRQREPIAPILRSSQLPALLAEVQPGLDVQALTWEPVHTRAFGRMLRGSLLWPLGLSGAAYLVVHDWAIAVLAALVAHAVISATLRSRYLGWALTPESIAVRDGALTRTIRVARFSRVQVVALVRNPFDLRTGMASVHADTAGARGGVIVPFLPQNSAAALQRELLTRTAATSFTW